MLKSRIREITTRRGARLVEHGVVLSEVLRQPGPTHSMADILAACVQSLAPRSPIALLGFAAGGMIAPLRTMGGAQPVHSVDISDASFGLFHRLCGAWAGDVTIQTADAEDWLRTGETKYDMIIEDLSIPSANDVFKPEATWTTLPRLVRSRLTPNGIAVFNLLRPKIEPWAAGIGKVAAPFDHARLITFDLYENRVLLAGRELPTARALSRALRSPLRQIRSRLAGSIAVHTEAP